MSLTQEDLQQIRSIVQDVVEPLIRPLDSEIKAIRNDIKELYDMIAKLQSGTITNKDFSKKSIEDKLLTLNAELIAAAKQAGIALPRN